MAVRIDLHTHSYGSPDGGLTVTDYGHIASLGHDTFVAVTDHNSIDAAREIKRSAGGRIIIGEEIRTTEGEIIGLYLQESVPKLLSPEETVAAIKSQGGLVCIPHPFEDVRRGITETALERIAKDVDIIEVHNGRAVFQNKSKQAYDWAKRYGWAGVASSDAHALAGWGKTYTEVAEPPTRENLVKQLHQATYRVAFPGVRAVLYPKFNRMKKRFQQIQKNGRRSSDV